MPIFRSVCTTLFALTAALAAGAAASGDVPADKPRLGLVLSGGGARGFSHIGALKALEELRVRFDVVAGTSMGSMVGGAYAAGYSAEQIEAITLAVDWPRMFAPSPDRERMSWQSKNDNRRGFSQLEIGVDKDGLHLPGQVVPSQELSIFLQRSTEPFSSVYDLSKLDIPFAAVATDLESGEAVVLQKNVTLAQAMRCSMSIPGAFRPVEHDGRILVDGGLVDNLPVGVARQMGAERVVAINAGTPLGKRGQIRGVVGVMGQVVNILTEQNVRKSRASLTDRDIYIEPDLSDFTSGDFMQAREIIEAGYRAVMDNKALFEPYRESSRDYDIYLTARHEKTRTDGLHSVSSVRVAGLERVNPERVLAEADIDTDKPVTNEEAAESARNIWASGDFMNVPFRFEPGPENTEVLVFEPEEKSIGYSTIRLGGNIQTDFQSSNTFNVLLSHTWSWLNDWGAEWRNEIQVGEVKRFLSEFLQPLGPASNWYVMPHLSYQWEPFDLYLRNDRIPVGKFRTEMLDAGVFFGYEFPRLGRIAAGGGWYESRIRTETYVENIKAEESSSFVSVRANFDTLDNASFPRRGFYFEGNLTYAINPHGSQDGGSTNPKTHYGLKAGLPVRLGTHTTVLLSGEGGMGSDADTYNLGGVFNLSGSPYGRYAGDRLLFGRAMVYHDISRTMRELGMPVYIGGTIEAGRIWSSIISDRVAESDEEWRHAASVFVASDSWIGPVYLVLGRTFGESSSLTFYWGRLW